MQLQTTLFLLGAAATALAQRAQYPECIQACIERRPTSSFCTGSETGSALDFCTCQSYSGTLLISCMQDCSESDRAVFAADAIPESCQDTLFPGVDVDNSGNSNSSPEPTTTGSSEAEATEEAAQETAEETTTVVEDVDTTTLPVAPTTIVTTATSSDAAEETNSETSASSTTGDDEASQTADESAAASESGDDDSAAMGLQASGLLAAGGLFAALLL